MKLVFSELAWEQYLDWQRNDARIVQKINALLKEKSTHC